MIRRPNIFKASMVFTFLAISNALGQQPTPTPKPPECSTPVYKSKEVDRRVKVLTYPEPKFDDREFDQYPYRIIILRAIFCDSGVVTDVKVERGFSPKLDQEAIRTAKNDQVQARRKERAEGFTVDDLGVSHQPILTLPPRPNSCATY